MKLFVYSYFPILSDLQFGGAQLIMRQIIKGCAKSGLDVTVICPETNNPDILPSDNNLQILPVLKTVESRPLFPYEYWWNLQQIEKHAQESDVIWSLDSAFPLEIPQPILLTLDQFSYREEMESLWSLSWDTLIVSSRYLWNIAQSLLGSDYWEGNPPAIKLIHYGIDTEKFSSVDPEPLCLRLNLSATDSSYILFPHRPDPNKGFDIALQVLSKLREVSEDYQLLIPINHNYESDKRYYNILRSRAEKMGLGSSVIFHPWIPLSDLPAYFSLGKWTLAVGSFPEGFGLTPVQSIACGTPVVSTRAGALGELFPPNHGVEYVDFGSVDQIVSHILKDYPEDEVYRGQKFVAERYSVHRLVREHIQCFETAKKRSARYKPFLGKTSVRLSPWCHLSEDGTIWHDYRMRKYKLTQKEMDFIRQLQAGISISSLESSQAHLTKLLKQGIIIGDITACS